MRNRPWFSSAVTNWAERSFRLTFIAGLLLLFPGTGVAGRLYVSPDGDDAHPGTQSQPLCTLQGARDRVRDNIIDLDGPDVAPSFTVLAGYRRTNVAVDAPPIHNHNYTYENNIVWSSSGAVFQIGGKVDKQTFKRIDNNVYYSPNDSYSFRQMTLDDWRRMGLDAHTQFADPLFVNRREHDFRLKPDSPALALGFQDIDTSEIGLKEDFPYENGGTGP